MSITGSSPRGRGTRPKAVRDGEGCRFIPARAGNTLVRSPCAVSCAVHPRAGGEHVVHNPALGRECGSSPRGRGTLADAARTHAEQRFIPARAGNTTQRPLGPHVSTVHPRAGGEHVNSGKRFVKGAVHPRAGGEHVYIIVLTCRIDGSSPRGRGTRVIWPAWEWGPRFIPARAGNTATLEAMDQAVPVHPRAGGEHNPLRRQRGKQRGSSPRGRGTLLHLARHLLGLRFIPARAGNTYSRSRRTPAPPVHPRAGGEHATGTRTAGRSGGSSPRGRGTQCRPTRDPSRRRFIPARAGNTRRPRAPASTTTVHPRAGGEHAARRPSGTSRPGSSPRGRGTRRTCRRARRSTRFIPARAGNTTRTASDGRRRSVHPRAGGEHGFSTAMMSDAPGSSPRGRGTRPRHQSRARQRRFIPARAGNTPAPVRA